MSCSIDPRVLPSNDIIQNFASNIDSTFAAQKNNGYVYLGDLIGKLFFDLYIRPSEFKIEELEEAIELGQKRHEATGLINGTLGIAYIIERLIAVGILSEEDSSSNDEEFIAELINSVNADISLKNYDLLDGLLSKGIYLLEIKKTDEIVRIIQALDDMRIHVDGNLIWVDYLNGKYFKDDLLAVNTGMAHGLTAIINFLLECIKQDIQPFKCKSLIYETLDFLMRFADFDSETVFPSKILVEDLKQMHVRRLAWCYGDLSTCLTFFKVAKYFNDQRLLGIAKDILDKTTLKDFHKSMLYQSGERVDLGFCHGIAGIAHVYSRIYQLSQIEAAAIAANYWTSKLMEGLNGFDFQFPEDIEKDTWGISNSILVGAASVCLPIFSMTAKNCQWDKIFLTNI